MSQDKKIIIETLHKIEKENNCSIIFASELGSRGWGMESADSDFDVRFVFKRRFTEYLKLNKSLDVLSLTEANRDFVGFDIFKFCGLLNASNSSAIEWVLSDIYYLNFPPQKLRNIIDSYFNPLALFQHYKSMCKQNYISYLKSGSDVTYKRYLYAMRGLMNSIYVQEYSKIPSIKFSDTLHILEQKNKVPLNVLKKIKEIISIKRKGNEKDKIMRLEPFDAYIESKLKENELPLPKKNNSLTREINQYILEELLPRS